MKEVLSQARKLAMQDAPLLIVGETGTGKELLARACHGASLRSSHPFMALNCAAMPDNVAESELFGYAPAPLAATPRASAACWSWRAAAP